MSPLELEGQTIPDEERYPVSWWSVLLGISVNTVTNAIIRGNVNFTWGMSIKKRPQRELYVSSFPQLIQGFKESTGSKGNSPHHPWSQVDTQQDTFQITPPSGKQITFNKE